MKYSRRFGLTLPGFKVKIKSENLKEAALMPDQEYNANLITLIDDEGVSHDFELLDAIETDDGRYVALLPYLGEDSTVEESEYYILQVVETDGEEELTEIEDEELLDTLAEIFEGRFEELYESE